MGYSTNYLPKALASLGHEVHLITSNGQVYFTHSTYETTWEPFLGPGVVEPNSSEVDGYTLHRLPHLKFRGRVGIKGLARKLRSLRPQIVETTEFFSVTTQQAAISKLLLGFKLFVGCHSHASVFPLARGEGDLRLRLRWHAFANTIGRITSALSEKAYPISADSAMIATQFLGINKAKVEISPLGVDTEIFSPMYEEKALRARDNVRSELGFSKSDVVCIYTGRMTRDKGPVVLAEAVGRLAAQGAPVRGLFVGNAAREDMEAIKAWPGCVTIPFVPNRELPRLYWASDIGVWPKQESTSQLDAAACGLPIILGDRVLVRERIDGNGLVYKEDDPHDLARKIVDLLDPAIRRHMGERGVDNMRSKFSWDLIARGRTRDYEAALER